MKKNGVQDSLYERSKEQHKKILHNFSTISCVVVCFEDISNYNEWILNVW